MFLTSNHGPVRGLSFAVKNDIKLLTAGIFRLFFV